MPIYEYDCQKCGTFEVSQKITEAPLEVHDGCGEKVTRRISVSSFSLKGGGWYADGYSSSSRGGGDSCSGSGCSGGNCSSGTQ